MAGRKPTPTHLKLVKGNPGRRPLPAKGKPAERDSPPAPAHLTASARRAWDSVSAMLARAGVLALVDAMAVELLCEAYADWRAARDELTAFGSNYYQTVNQAGGIMHRAHPALAVMRDADRRIKAWLAEFGMTPSARTRIDVAPASDEPADPAEKYFR